MDDKEREAFVKLRNIRVVFDIGARDTEYPDIKPKAEYHLFEPNREFFDKLVEKYKGRENIHINNFAVGDKEEIVEYNTNSQSFKGSECEPNGGYDTSYPMKRLDAYIKEHNIKRIDFLKIDTEGYDYIILKSSPKAVKLARYIQYETWKNKQPPIDLLGKDFEMEDIGSRNILCKRR